ncbi:IclR family transcriptional regulator [Streptomyces sp. NBC_01571]|uniref:IclR family transcriptional regulator domain-containing protein n=1 Tax=Streptomyces sp. NBC_01571 TaxID=2975883 RepID=UPI002253B384|nr:IclR family transcriptional regulator C-terminal domain-containing protein [Streptomyces sp. NBC_01571]MCX4578985.1 IclR family transcriptional regulator [Streptomyces sp. NBC_01571]
MTGNEISNASETGSRLVDRFIRVQKAFAQLGGDVHGTGEIAKAAGLDDSTASRILQSGVYGGLFERIGRGKYRLGATAAHLGMHALASAPAKDDSTHTILEELREATDGGLVFQYMLAPFGGAQRQCIDMAVGDSDLVELGMTALDILSVTRSLRTGASGRTILAYLPTTLQELVLAEPIPAEAGPGVYRDDKELLASLEEVRDRGYALGYEECMPLWNSCAAPIVWGEAIMGAALLLKPATVMPEAPESVIEATKTAASQLSARLSHLSEPMAMMLGT